MQTFEVHIFPRTQDDSIYVNGHGIRWAQFWKAQVYIVCIIYIIYGYAASCNIINDASIIIIIDIFNIIRRVVFWNDANGSAFVLSNVGNEGIESHPLVVEDCTVLFWIYYCDQAYHELIALIKIIIKTVIGNIKTIKVVYARATWHHWSGEAKNIITTIDMTITTRTLPFASFKSKQQMTN